MTPIALRQLRKVFGSTVAVNDVDIDIASGDLFFLLGPSGCGKTTLLRLLAGFTEPTAGIIRFGQKDVTALPPNKRDTGMVFQGYALWPHMTVAANVAFGLEVRKIASDQKAKRVADALAMVQMAEFADRKPNQLSGGQQQRVALARALVIEPTVLLLDEPLSNLDARLRLEMRSSIRAICKQAGITTVYVTHDQKEAISMADRMAVLRDGVLEQVGGPQTLYERPRNRFVADFLGEANFLEVSLIGMEGGQAVVESVAGRLQAAVFPDPLPDTGRIICCIRPEAVKLLRDGEQGANVFEARRDEVVYLGGIAQHRLNLRGGLVLKAFELNPRSLPAGESIRISVDPSDVVILSD